jgi:hypothetical protein
MKGENNMAYQVTPMGKSQWAKIAVPDTKFVADGEYSIRLRLKGASATKLQASIDKAVEKAVAKAVEDNPNKKIKKGTVPYVEVVEDGNQTGELEFKFKQKKIIQTKNGPIEKKVVMFDANNKPIVEKLLVGNGSDVKVAYDPKPYYTPTQGASVSLKLVGVQILNLVPYNNDDSAESLGFKKEDGYSHNNSTGGNDEEEDISFEEQKEEADF